MVLLFASSSIFHHCRAKLGCGPIHSIDYTLQARAPDTCSMNNAPCSSCWAVDSSEYLPYPSSSSLAHALYYMPPFHYKEIHCRWSNSKLTTKTQGGTSFLCITTFPHHLSMLRHALLAQDPLHREQEKLGYVYRLSYLS